MEPIPAGVTGRRAATGETVVIVIVVRKRAIHPSEVGMCWGREHPLERRPRSVTLAKLR